MDNFFLFLNTLIKRVVFGEFTMWLIFLFVGLFFIPSEWALYLNAKTPVFFPDWLSGSHIGAIVFSFVLLMIYFWVESAFKWLCRQYQVRKQKAEYQHQVKQLKSVMEALSQNEIHVVQMIIRNQFTPTFIPCPHETFLLERKGVIMNVAKLGCPAIWCLTNAAYECLTDELVRVKPIMV